MKFIFGNLSTTEGNQICARMDYCITNSTYRITEEVGIII